MSSSVDESSTCSVPRAARLLGWSESKVRRHEERLGAHRDERGYLRLSAAAVMLERRHILDELGAVEAHWERSESGDRRQFSPSPDRENYVNEIERLKSRIGDLEAELVRLEEVIRSLLVAEAAHLDAMRQYANPASTGALLSRRERPQDET